MFTVGTRVVLHGLKADILNLRRGTIVKSQTAEDRVGVRLDGELKPKSVPRANVRLERGPHETGEPDEIHENVWCDNCSTMSARDHMLHDALASMRTGRAGAATRSETQTLRHEAPGAAASGSCSASPTGKTRACTPACGGARLRRSSTRGVSASSSYG